MPYPALPGTVIETRRSQPHSVHTVYERGVVLHPAMTWTVAYFPGDPGRFADPADPASIRVVPLGDVVGYHDLAECEPAWVAGTWHCLHSAGPGLLQAPGVVAIWRISAQLARARLKTAATTLISHDQLEEWVGRPVSPEELPRIDRAISHSSVVDAVQTVVDALDASPDP